MSAFPAYLKDKGVPSASLLTDVGINPQVVNLRDAAISLSSVAQLFELTARRVDDAAFGLSYARSFPIGGTGLLGQILMSAPTVRDLFVAVSRYLEVHMGPVPTRFDERAGVGRLAFSWPPTMTGSLTQLTGFYLALLVLRLRQATGPHWTPLAVDFQHRSPVAIDDYRALFGSRLTFGQPENMIAVDPTSLSRRMPILDRELRDALHESLLEFSAHKVRELNMSASHAERLTALIAARLASERRFDLEAVAEAMEMSARALQWRLEQDGTSYEKVLLETRAVEAERYLRDTTHPLTRIAELLGFSELSAFTRWAQRRFGSTPTALRQRLRKGGSLSSSTTDDPA